MVVIEPAAALWTIASLPLEDLAFAWGCALW